MFSLVSGLYSEYFSPQQINLLVVGVQGSGKTTVLERIKVTNFATQSVTLSDRNHIRHGSIVDDTAIAAAAAAAAVTASQQSYIESQKKKTSTDSTTSQLQQQQQQNHHHHRTNTIGPTPEILRSKIFLTDNVDDYEAPKRGRRKKKKNTTTLNHNNISSTHHAVPKSRFGWICPPPPRFTLLHNTTRLDISDRSSSNNLLRNPYHNNDDDEFSTDAFDMNDDHNQFWDDHEIDENDSNDDENDDHDHSNAMDTTLLSTTSAARSRRTGPTSSTTTILTATSAITATTMKGLTNTGSRHNNKSSTSFHNGGPVGLPAPRRITAMTGSSSNNKSDDLRKSSMESIDLTDRQRYTASTYNNIDDQQPQFMKSNDNSNDDETTIVQYDVKNGCKMLSMEKIRPTIGMNLCKTQICGSTVHVWDLGGKLYDLWERYYDDADAVLFVWRLCRTDIVQQQQKSNDDDDDDSVVHVTAEQQMKVLEQVRSSVPDDVPFCLLGHLFQIELPYNCEPDVLYSTSPLLSHYHNPLQSLFIANAMTGQGIKTAIEWLTSTAKRQQRIRKRTE
jgi:hypothetical protein